MSKAISAEELAARYLPSNGSEGMDFEGHWCEGGNGGVCRYFVTKRAGYDDCTRGIIVKAHAADAGDRSTWPHQWRYVNGRPTCIAFTLRGGSLKRGLNERERYERAMGRTS